MTVSRTAVVEAIAAAFPAEARARLRAMVDAYGGAPHEREGERVQLAIVRLSEGDEAKLGYRNPYDRIGHLVQGLVPALVAREILLRNGYVAGRRMAAFLSGCVALAISASYELIEWWSALALGQGADEFLGTQGDPWDTQSDMFFALVGGSLALLTLSRVHDRQMAAVAAGATR